MTEIVELGTGDQLRLANLGFWSSIPYGTFSSGAVEVRPGIIGYDLEQLWANVTRYAPWAASQVRDILGGLMPATAPAQLAGPMGAVVDLSTGTELRAGAQGAAGSLGDSQVWLAGVAALAALALLRRRR